MVSPLLHYSLHPNILFLGPSSYNSIQHCLSVGWLKSERLSVLSKWNTELEESGNDLGEVVEESIIILGVLLDPWQETLILDQNVIGWKHHQRLSLLVLELLWSIPLLPLPALLKQQSVVVVGQHGW